MLCTVLVQAAAAQASATGFSSSLEGGDPQPTWTNTAERASGVTGPARQGIPGNVTDTVVAVRASGENADGGEVKENLVDGSEQSKWLVFETTGWVELELADPVKVVRYALTSANDAAERDPRDWTLEGSNDGTSWTTLDTRSGQDFSERFQTKEYAFANDVAYRHYRLDITANHGDGLIQLAELQLSNGDTNPPPAGDMRSIVGAGPRGGYNAKSGVGFTGVRALQYAGRHTSEDRGYSYNKVFDVDVAVTRKSELSYLIYPDFERDDLSYPSTYAAVDLAFTDGTFLSDLGAKDQHGATLSPQGQGASKTLYIAGGGTLEFDMGPSPSQWATGKDAAPPSVTKGDEPAQPLRDTTGGDDGTATTSGGDAAALFDNDSSTVASLTGSRPWLQYRFTGSRPVTFYTLTSGTADGGDPSAWVVKGSNDGSRWKVLDERSGETFRWRSQTRPFKLSRPGSYAYYRIEVTKGGGRLGEVELLNPGKADTSPLVTDVDRVVASAGDTVPVRVTVSNYGEGAASGSVAATAQDWQVEPASAAFGPLANGESKTLEFQVSVPAGTAAGTYPVKVTVSSNQGTAKAAGSITVIGDHVEFTPGSDSEAPWLFESDGSQFDGEGRFTDGGRHATCRFQLPADVQGGTFTLDIGNQFLVDASTDNQSWTTVLKEDAPVRDLSNRSERTLDLNALRGSSSTLYLRLLGDSQPDDGWGGWLARVELDLQRGGG